MKPLFFALAVALPALISADARSASQPAPAYRLACEEIQMTETVAIITDSMARVIPPLADESLEWNGYRVRAKVAGSPELTVTLPGGIEIRDADTGGPRSRIEVSFPPSDGLVSHTLSCMLKRN